MSGTNSLDRQVGGSAILHSLVERGAIGLVTTHDLALTELSGARGNRIANVHFTDRVQAGHISFDYLIRGGPVRQSNSIELMRLIGLDI